MGSCGVCDFALSCLNLKHLPSASSGQASLHGAGSTLSAHADAEPFHSLQWAGIANLLRHDDNSTLFSESASQVMFGPGP